MSLRIAIRESFNLPPTMAHRDGDQRNRLLDLIEEATVSPSTSLDLGLLHSIKATVRASDANVHTAFEVLYDKLKKNHSQVRYLAVLLIDELFTRSKLFRALLVPKFEMFMLLTIGYRDDYPLPKPPDRATLLRTTSMEYVEKWNDMFGVHYRQVRLGYDYLKKTLRLQFPNLRASAALAEQQRHEKEARTQALLKKKFESLSQDFPESRIEIQSTLEQISECCKILHPESASIPNVHDPAPESGASLEQLIFGEEEDEYEEYGDSRLRRQLHEEFSEDIIPVVEQARETSDNAAVFETLRDLYKIVMTSHLRITQEWLSILMRVDISDTQTRDALLKEVIDIRNQLLGSREKCESLGIARLEVGSTRKFQAEDEDDIIWEEGDDGIGAINAENIMQQGAGKSTASNIDAVSTCGPSSAAVGHFAPEKVEEEQGPRIELLKKAPVLPYGSFLDSWGAKTDVPANQRGLQLENHWGKFDSEAMIPADKIAELNVRSSYYNPLQKEIPPCRAPLKKGGLCPRKDLHRCPLHGPIIPRDENGSPILAKLPEKKNRGESEFTESMIPSSSSAAVDAEINVNPLMAHSELAAQAIANVRGKDTDEAKKKRDERAMKINRVQKKRDREHNNMVLRAAALSQTHQGFQESFSSVGDSGSDIRGGKKKRARGGLTALLRKNSTAKERIAERLLNSRVQDNAANELSREEEARNRDSFANRWEMK